MDNDDVKIESSQSTEELDANYERLYNAVLSEFGEDGARAFEIYMTGVMGVVSEFTDNHILTYSIEYDEDDIDCGSVKEMMQDIFDAVESWDDDVVQDIEDSIYGSEDLEPIESDNIVQKISKKVDNLFRDIKKDRFNTEPKKVIKDRDDNIIGKEWEFPAVSDYMILVQCLEDEDTAEAQDGKHLIHWRFVKPDGSKEYRADLKSELSVEKIDKNYFEDADWIAEFTKAVEAVYPEELKKEIAETGETSEASESSEPNGNQSSVGESRHIKLTLSKIKSGKELKLDKITADYEITDALADVSEFLDSADAASLNEEPTSYMLTVSDDAFNLDECEDFPVDQTGCLMHICNSLYTLYGACIPMAIYSETSDANYINSISYRLEFHLRSVESILASKYGVYHLPCTLDAELANKLTYPATIDNLTCELLNLCDYINFYEVNFDEDVKYVLDSVVSDLRNFNRLFE